MENMGINQLANMFMGNPQPLAQKVQQAQQQAKPGQIPQDLEAAIALQKIQEMRNAAGNQQALQAGGAQPTVVEQLKQMLAPQQAPQNQQQAPQVQQAVPQAPQMQSPAPQDQQHPPMPQAPQGAPTPSQGVSQLPSNLKQNYQGGGIIAFDEGGDVSERDMLRRLEAEYNPRTSEGLMGQESSGVPLGLADEARRQMAARLRANPEQMGIAAEARARAALGAPDTAGYDRAVEELTKRRTQMDAPKTGMPALMEYLSQVAQAPKGMGSLSAGSFGAQNVNALQKQREQGQFDLTKQILEQEQKKMDTTRGYAKEMYGVSKSAYDQAFKDNYDAAKQITSDDQEAKKIAATATENQLNRENQLLMERERGKTTLAAASAPGQSERVTKQIIALKAKGTPEALAQAEDLLKTYSLITGSGAAGVGADRNQTAKLRLELVANQAVLKDIDATDEDKAEARAAIADIRERLKTAVTPIAITPDGIPATQPGKKPAATPTVLKFDASGNPIKG